MKALTNFLNIRLLYLALLLMPGLLSAQTVQLSGIVSDQNGERVSFANVMIKGSTKGTVAKADGTFTLNTLTPGTYTLVVSRVGHRPYEQQLSIAEGKARNLSIQLAELNEELDEVTVTATRTTRSVESIPMPVDVISGEQIAQMGSFRLNEVLQEQTGLQIVSDHGTGLQMQGLSSDYILVLIDGEPVIGRTAGTLDLTRIAVDNIARIEIIRGPSSSLYGSEAMAGVVNIITKSGQQGFNSSLRARYRSFNTIDLSADAGYKGEKLSASLFVDRLSTDGYDLDEETLAMTSPPYEAYTFNPKFGYRFSDKINFSLNGRYYSESQDNTSELSIEEEVHLMDEEGSREDWNIMPTLELKLNDQHRLQLRSYTTGYDTKSGIIYQEDGEVYDESYFQQLFNRSEAQYDWYISDQHISTLGLGHTIETVEATRYDDVNNFHANYAFIQHQWLPHDRFNVVLGGRIDTHSEYASRFSPKLAAGYQLSPWLKVQASFGGGYKAPDFRQLLLNFTNPTAGYTVIGSSIVEERMAELEAQGQIQTLYMDPATIETIQAESSIAYNLGLSLSPTARLKANINAFRNEISHMINSAPVALKTNGQNVFSYFNTDEVITQGVEVKANYQLTSDVNFSLGYQYLDTRDVEAVEQIRKGEVFRRNPSTNRTERVPLSDYGGLINRSRHSGNAKLFYANSRHEFDLALRAIYRGKWGLGDANGNGVIDAENEFADGYLLLNLAVNKNLLGWLTLEAGANNLLDQTPSAEPSLAGRIWYGGININFTDLK